jgi:hypothetical protein
MKLKNIKEITKEDLLLTFGWIATWLSIGITPEYLINFKFSLSINLLNYIRGIIPIIYLILVAFYFSDHIKSKIIFRNNYIIIFLGLYFAAQIIPLIIKKSSNIEDVYYLILSVNTLLIIFLKMHQKKEDKIFFYLSILFIFLLFINFFFPQIKNFVYTPLTFYEQWGIASEKEDFLKNIKLDIIYPNILGFSRYVLILFFFAFFFINKYNFLRIVVITFFSSLLFLLQARATLLVYLIFVFFHPFIFKNLKIMDYLKKILLLLLVPIIIFFSFQEIKKKIFFKQKIELRNQAEITLYNEEKIRLFRKLPLTNETNPKVNYSSDRFNDWALMIDGSKKEFWGLGPQADRNYYKKTASNGFVYSFVCAGYFGLLFFVILFIYSLYTNFKSLLALRNLPSNFNKVIYPVICLAFLIRSIFETSFAVFGIDFILFFYCLFMVHKINKQFN